MTLFQEEYTELLQNISNVDPKVAELVQEAMPRVQMMLQAEDIGWQDLFSYNKDRTDPSEALEFAKTTSELSRQMTYGSPLIDRGLDLRQSYVWSKGISISGIKDEGQGARPGPKSKREKFFASHANRRYLLSAEGFKDMESSAYNDGSYFFLGDVKTKTGHPVPISEIDGVLTNPDYSGEVWAYRRNRNIYKPGQQNPENLVEWIYVDTFTGDKTNPEGDNPQGSVKSRVNKDKVFFVKTFNTMVGDAVGVPDSLPALLWARIYAEMVNDGRTVSRANAKFTYKVKNNTASGAENAAAKISKSQGVGKVAALGKDNDLISIPQSNRSYDFNGLRPIAAMVATALSVSVIHLLSDPGAAGSSYGSASNLDLPTKRAMASRQSEWVDFLERIIKWGTGEDLKVSFFSLDDQDPYREAQLITMGWNSGVIHTDEMRARMIEVGGFQDINGDAPEGVLVPNNELSLARRDIDTDGTDKGTGATPGSSVSPDQGVKNGTGGVSDSTAKDLRNESYDEKLEVISQQISLLAQYMESGQ